MAFNPDAYLSQGSQGGSGFDPDAYLGNTQPQETDWKKMGKILPGVAQFAIQDTMKKTLPTGAVVAAGAIGGAIPAGLTAGGLAIANRMKGIASGEQPGTPLSDPNATLFPASPMNMAKEAIGPAGQATAAAIMQEPKVLNSIPGVSQVNQFIGKTASATGRGLANFMQAMTGAKADVLKQAAKQGMSETYAPKGLGLMGGMEKAQNIFGKAAESAGTGGRPPLKQVIDPALQTARKVALDIGNKLEKGLDISAGEALNARQAIDRIYNATSLLDRSTRGHLADLRTAFDDVMAGKSGALKEASTLYRKAIVKDTLLNLFKITKQGQISAVAPMVATLAASAGLGSGHKGEAGLGALGYLAASSPMVAGLGATAGGSAVRGLMQLGQNPAIRQTLLGVLQQLMAKKSSQQP